MLKYTGGGYGGSQPGIPARDLTDSEVIQFGGESALIATGLYEKPIEVVARRGKSDSPIGQTLNGDAEEIRKLARKLSSKEGD